MKVNMKFRKSILILIWLFINSFAFSEEAIQPPKILWGFEGFSGTFDRQSIQRGLQIYTQVCSACHSLKLLSYRNLNEIGFSEAEVKAIAAQYSTNAEPDEHGEIKQRPALPSDSFVPPFPNENAARAANGGAYPVDQSLIVKARENGPDYIYALLTGYRNPPANIQVAQGKYYNPYFPGGQISMPPPLHDNIVTYSDGTPATLEQMSKDIINFLQWAAEPEMEKRKSMGIKSLLYLFIMTVFFILAKKRIWQRLK
jgi:ubiquinol-cytochrome c reductase cytochrome c1 subunit